MIDIKGIEAEIRETADREGYRLNPDHDIRLGIIEGLAANQERLGYRCCPCRLASGDRQADQDINCPCAYRDADLEQYGRCYCALYVTGEYLDRGSPPDPIPERRNAGTSEGAKVVKDEKGGPAGESMGIKVWRCIICGYLCARPGPPQVCPICKAKSDKFEQFRL
jgi:ferredoxin-thioredoxin reductase catalytic subunit